MILKQGKRLLICLCVLLTISFTGAVTANAMEGSGLADSPYEIKTKEDLLAFAGKVSGGETGACAKLTENIKLNNEVFTFIPDTGLVYVTDGTNTAYLGTGITGDESGENTDFDNAEVSTGGKWYIEDTDTQKFVEGSYGGEIELWTPIGTEKIPYTGSFDGNGKTISGIYINNSNSFADCFGLFGVISEPGKISNLGIVSSFTQAADGVGGICGYNAGGEISGCYNTGFVFGSRIIGGVCGANASPKEPKTGELYSGVISQCFNTGHVLGGDFVGGICGINGMNENIDRDAGGLITESYNTGTISGSEYVGGVIGFNTSINEDIFGMVSFCYNIGEVSGTGSYVDKFCADNGGTVSSCYFLGDQEDNVGGTTVMSAAQFASGEVAWLLNTSGKTKESSKIWAQGPKYPIFADKVHQAVLGEIKTKGAVDNSTGIYNGESIHISDAAPDADGIYTADLALTAAAPILTDSIAIKFTAVIGKALLKEATPTINFTFLGKETTVTGEKEEGKGEDYSIYTFTFRGIYPQYMCENIKAELKIGDATVSKSVYSVRQYALTMLKKDAAALNFTGDNAEQKLSAFQSLLVDMLFYGDATQKYKAEQTNDSVETTDLATYGLTDVQQAYRTADKTGEIVSSDLVCMNPEEGNLNYGYFWDSASVVLTDRINFRFKLTVPDQALINQAVTDPDLFSVKVYINEDCIDTINTFLPTGEEGQYSFDFSAISASNLGKKFVLKMFKGNTEIGCILTYSMNSYISFVFNQEPVASAALKELMRSIYGYGLSAAAYSNLNQN